MGGLYGQIYAFHTGEKAGTESGRGICGMLAGLPNAPSIYSMEENRDLALALLLTKSIKLLNMHRGIESDPGLNDDDTITVTDKGGPFSKVDVGIVKYRWRINGERNSGLPEQGRTV